MLEVLRILAGEIDLREETRASQQARPILAQTKYREQAKMLAGTQQELAERVDQVKMQIEQLPEATQLFGREIALMSRVAQVMREAQLLLARPETGPETIAAETEAIELLLQARRVQPRGGGGGGSSPGGGGSGTTQESALALIGRGSDPNASTTVREVRQATGITGGEMPVEFRTGLDAYFSALEESRNAD